MSSKARWYEKANAYADAWQFLLSEPAPMNAMVLGLAVAQHETLCGDAWPGEHNWGAVQLGPLNAFEAQLLVAHGIQPHPNNVEGARAVFAEAGIDNPHGALHVDYSPRKGHYYWVWFCKFPSDVEGAERCVQVLAKDRPSCREVLERSTGTESQLAEAMYAKGYYEGIHEPHALYEYDDQAKKWVKVEEGATTTGPTAIGADLNIQDYGRALSKWTPQIRVMLAGWAPGATIPPPAPSSAGFDLSSWLGRQQALNFVGSVPMLDEDGLPGPQTKASTLFFQRAAALGSPDGEWTQATRDAMTACLSTIPGAPRVLSI